MSFMALPPFENFACYSQAAPLRAPPGNRSRPTFANGLISIKELLLAIHKAGCECAADFEGAGDGFHFLFAEFASTPAGEYAIILVHKFLLILVKR
jgi:hypothetical protein